ncbi:MAG: ATP phosphoribosyltransferase regulatory subunit [Gammaproteobacteria bacterium]|nr:ATP phosphoribosyltransferase regulatory subunit [Gammaproteobacteria bacterium]
MRENDRWLLPEGIGELLPPEAAQLERLRRRLLDLFGSWGYELVEPPLIEYLESLLTGTGNDLDLHTFKITDQLTGRLMGVRADMTPQVARIDSHRLKLAAPTRLCYLGAVLRTRPQELGGTRSPLQVGAELYGHEGIESDLEVMSLMAEALRCVGVTDLHMDLGHVGIFRGLAREAGLSADVEAQLFDALQRKARPEVEAILADAPIAPADRARLAVLNELNGGREVLDQAASLLRGAGQAVQHCFANLSALALAAARRLPDVRFHIDLAELRGYHYHTGAVFAAFVPGRGQAIAQGGRYDDIGRVYGRARPATGFSMDLKALVAYSSDDCAVLRGIFAPPDEDPALEAEVRALRAAGERVVRALPGQTGSAAEVGCDRLLKRRADGWQVVALD